MSRQIYLNQVCDTDLPTEQPDTDMAGTKLPRQETIRRLFQPNADAYLDDRSTLPLQHHWLGYCHHIHPLNSFPSHDPPDVIETIAANVVAHHQGYEPNQRAMR